ncbi:MAG: class I SAM-dependent methyltransferase [Rhodospirillaceae bacterium]|nr:class I SAM-dependent methyltransferase [Rhodospirillaceae bacterium]
MARIKQTKVGGGLDDYILDYGLRETAAQKELRAATAGRPGAGMQIGAPQGALMALLVQAIGARRCIEIGVFTGYSALAVALALPDDGTLVACDVSEDYTAVGKPFWKKAKVVHKIDLRIGPARETVAALLKAGEAGRFDFAFIDADKANYDAYYEGCLKLLRPGGIIAVDNVLWGGSVIDDRKQDEDTVAIRALNEKIHKDKRVSMCLVPISDGVTLALKRG